MFLAFCCSHKVYWLGNLCACALLSSSHCLLTAWGGQWKTHTEDLLWASSHSTAHPSSPLPRPLCQPEARDTQPSPLSWEPDPGPPVYFISRTQLFQNGNFHPSSQTCFYPLRFPAVVNGLWESWVFLDTFVFQIQFNIKTKTHHFLPSALSPPRSFEPNPLTLVGYCKSHYLISAYLANVTNVPVTQPVCPSRLLKTLEWPAGSRVKPPSQQGLQSGPLCPPLSLLALICLTT